jgi:hypothetical protein
MAHLRWEDASAGVSSRTIVVRILRALVQVTTRVGGRLTGYTRHGLHQAISRERSGVSPRAILDAVPNPQRVIQRGGGITEYVGEVARVRLNRVGQVVTVIATSRRGFRIPGDG